MLQPETAVMPVTLTLLVQLHHGLQVLEALFQGVVPDAVQLVRKQLKETVPTCNHNLVMSCFNLMDSLLQPYLGQEGAHWALMGNTARS